MAYAQRSLATRDAGEIAPQFRAVAAKETFIGTPSECIAQIRALAAVAPIDPIIVRAQWPDMPADAVEAYLDDLGREIIPALGSGVGSPGRGRSADLPAQFGLGHLLQRRARQLPTTRISTGRLNGGSRAAQAASAPPGSRRVAAASTNATGTSPQHRRAGGPPRPPRAPPATASSTRSISGAPTFSPPTFSTSLSRSTKVSVPSGSRRTRSPVRNQPPSVNARRGRRRVAEVLRRTARRPAPRARAAPARRRPTSAPASSTTATPYSGAGRPMLPGRSVQSGAPQIGWETVSVMPNQPIAPTPPGPAPGGMRQLLPPAAERVRGRRRPVGERPHAERHHRRPGAPVPHGDVPEARRREPRLQHHRRAGPQAGQERVRQRVGVEQRQVHEVDVGRAQPLVRGADPAAPQAVGLGPHDRLGPGGGAGGVLDRRRPVRVGAARPAEVGRVAGRARRRRPASAAGHRRADVVGYEARRSRRHAGVPGVVGQLVAAAARVEADRHRRRPATTAVQAEQELRASCPAPGPPGRRRRARAACRPAASPRASASNPP